MKKNRIFFSRENRVILLFVETLIQLKEGGPNLCYFLGIGAEHLKFFIQNGDRYPFCKAFYERKLTSMKKWHQSINPKKMAKVWSPFFQQILFYLIIKKHTF